MTRPADSDTPAYTRIRAARRAVEDRADAYALLDRSLLAHVAFIAEGRPMTLPMVFARVDHTLYVHGHSKPRIMRATQRAPLCLTVTRVDGMVVARSGFHHSMNYAGVTVHGTGRLVEGPEAGHALDAMVDHLLPGRSAEIRPMTAQKRKATRVIALDIEAITMKRREGPPIDDAADLAAGGWGGVVPLGMGLGDAMPDTYTGGAAEPASVHAARAKFHRAGSC